MIFLDTFPFTDTPKCCQISIVSIGSRNLTAKWKALSNGNDKVIRYQLTLKNRFSVRSFHVNGSKDIMEFEGLTPGLRYQLAISAENSIGTSNTSYIQVETLKEGLDFPDPNFTYHQ